MVNNLDKIRAEIDALDLDLLRGLEARSALVREISALKQAAGAGQAFRPGREAILIRKLIASSNLSPSLLIYVWRQIIAASLAQQQKQTFGLYAGDALPQALASAKAWSGGGGGASEIEIFDSPEKLFTKIEQAQAMIGFIPCNNQVDWWQAMSADIFVVARWSYIKEDKALPLFIFAKQAPEPSGDDCALLVKNNQLVIEKGFITKEQAQTNKADKFLGCFASLIE